MPKKGEQYPVRTDLRLHATASATASYKRKKTTTEIIPPDVTRAKAGRWLDLISPITEWAGLRGDALRFQRDQLQIRQEAALDQLAQNIQRSMVDRTVVHPLPPKILVPALEAASLESPDSPLIEWWANLFVSGATCTPIRPFLIDIMSKIGTDEATLLEQLWTNFRKQETFAETFAEFEESPSILETLLHVIASYNIQKVVSDFETAFSEECNSGGKISTPRTGANVFLTMGYLSKASSTVAQEYGIGLQAEAKFNLDSAPIGQSSENIGRSLVPLDVCRALNLLEVHERTGQFDGGLGGSGEYRLKIFHFTALGLEFMRATRVSP